MEEKIYWIWLTRIKKVKPSFLYILLTKYKNLENLWKKTKKELITDGVDKKIAEEITNNEYKKDLNKDICYMKENNIDIITILNEKYPKKLKQIYDPPIAFYLKGNKEILNDTSIAIIGSRLCSDYGKYVAEKLACQLSKNKITIISGLAKGIDAKAHNGAIRANNTTIAVVGCGLDTVYPKENEKLYDKIIKSNGAIISEYPIGTKPLSENFPARNRIISGLSDGVIVVEATNRSGALITVDFALEQGKEIYVVPGSITSVQSLGTNNLIKQGAKVITNVNDVLEDLRKIKYFS